ncbi:MAG: nitroreductase family protein [Candidatus Cloacimonetes bacterium]|nr:nitroreductase family protein [Candidatus Cloacimonadota bacterium]
MEFKKVMENRRAVNNFDPEKGISDELLKEIIDLAVLAPSAFNLQPWRIIAVKTAEAKVKLFDLANKQPKIKTAPVSLIIVGDRGAYRDENSVWDNLEAAMGNEAMIRARNAAKFLYGSTEERQIKFSESNAGLLAMSIMYAAKGLGVDSHPMSGIDFEGIKFAFNLHPDESVVMVIALGYHDESKPLYPRGPRKGFDEIVEIV